VVVRAEGVTDPSGVKSVQFAVYREADGDASYKLYNAYNYGGGLWAMEVNLNALGGKNGKYIINVYGTDNRDNWAYMGQTSVVLDMDQSAPTVQEISVSNYDTYGRSKTIHVKGVTDPSGIAGVTIGVYSMDNGYDDWVKYPAQNWGNGSWGIILDTAAHKYTGGTYEVYVYTTDGLGNTGMAKYGTFYVPYSNPTSGNAYNVNYNGFFEFKVYGIDSYYGVKDVYFYIYTNDSDGQWYHPTFYSTQDYWYTFVQRYDYGYSTGTYYKDVYIEDMRGSFEYVTTYYNVS
jgi:hypothetical protein